MESQSWLQNRPYSYFSQRLWLNRWWWNIQSPLSVQKRREYGSCQKSVRSFCLLYWASSISSICINTKNGASKSRHQQETIHHGANHWYSSLLYVICFKPTASHRGQIRRRSAHSCYLGQLQIKYYLQHYKQNLLIKFQNYPIPYRILCKLPILAATLEKVR